MVAGTIREKWSRWTPDLLSALRIIAAGVFMSYGTMKLFAYPAGVPPTGGTVPFLSQMWFAGVLEVVGGGLLLVGFFTRPVALLVSGEMAVAYLQAHAGRSVWPVLN